MRTPLERIKKTENIINEFKLNEEYGNFVNTILILCDKHNIPENKCLWDKEFS